MGTAAEVDDSEGDSRKGPNLNRDDEVTVNTDGGTTTPPPPKEDCTPEPVGLLRDFRSDHPDFERDRYGLEFGIVKSELGEDRKPVFGGGDGEKHTVSNDGAYFDQWYRDTPDVNQSFEFVVDLQEDPATGNAVFDSVAFFPLDGKGFGNYVDEEGKDWGHNYHFTYELHMEFRYEGHEIFTFRGDDDLWVFINNKLAIDLGGVHLPEEQRLILHQRAADLGLEVGGTYPLDFFHAERHTGASNFRIESTLTFTNCDKIIIR